MIARRNIRSGGSSSFSSHRYIGRQLLESSTRRCWRLGSRETWFGVVLMDREIRSRRRLGGWYGLWAPAVVPGSGGDGVSTGARQGEEVVRHSDGSHVAGDREDAIERQDISLP